MSQRGHRIFLRFMGFILVVMGAQMTLTGDKRFLYEILVLRDFDLRDYDFMCFVFFSRYKPHLNYGYLRVIRMQIL